MDKEYQRQEAMKDILIKNDRIKVLEKQLKEANTKLSVCVEGLKHIKEQENWVIATMCLNEIKE